MENLDRKTCAVSLDFRKLHVGDEFVVVQTGDLGETSVPAGTVIRILEVTPLCVTAAYGAT